MENTPIIELKNVSKTFNGTRVIQNISLKIYRGDTIAIIGASGCGKSTLLRIILGLHTPDSGEVLIHGQNLNSLSTNDQKKMRLKFGMVFQYSALFDSMTVRDNVSFSLRENLKVPTEEQDKIVKEKLEMVDMSNTEHMMPSDLSGGMKKRIGFARAIATHPEIVLYDEPTAGLDPILCTSIEKLICKLNQQLQITSVVVTHQISTILSTAEKIYLMHNGCLLPPESPKTIMDSADQDVRWFISGGAN